MSPIIRAKMQLNPYPYQRKLLEALFMGKRYACLVWHRRSGKDLTCFAGWTVFQALSRVANYYYYYPSAVQGRKLLWDNKDNAGQPFRSYIPSEAIRSVNETEMKITLHNNSIIQVLGTNDPNSVVGPNPFGCVFSEYALQSPLAWNFTRPIIRQNGGWAIFNFTPRGKNHAYNLYQMAKNNPEWYCELLTVNDTTDNDGKPIVPPENVQAERDANMSEELIQQEFYCSFSGSMEGAYYAKQISRAYADNRIGRVPWEPKLPVHTAWDLGLDKGSDTMAIWFYQILGREVRLIEYVHGRGEGFPYYAKILKERPYAYDRHYAPFDINVKEMTGKTRKDTARGLGIRFKDVPRLEVADGIDFVRNLFPRLWIDADKCADGLNALSSYTHDKDEMTGEFTDHPKKDWTNHAADALRYLAVSLRDDVKIEANPKAISEFNPLHFNPERELKAVTDFNPFGRD